jgi:hypothetical protein
LKALETLALCYFLETKTIDIGLYLQIHFAKQKLGLEFHKLLVINLFFIHMHMVFASYRHIINKKNFFVLLVAIGS